MRKLFISLLFLLSSALCRAEAPLVLSFEGHQTVDKLQDVKNQLDKFSGDKLILRIDSWTGDLKLILALAQQVHSLKASKGIKISVYFENRAIGPVAILPFLADDWIGTESFVWGDITYGSDHQIPKNQLVSMVVDLISDDSPDAALLKMMATVMIDPALQLVEKNGWGLADVPSPRDPAVINRSELSKMGFSILTMSPRDFLQKYGMADVTVLPSDTAFAATNESLAKHIHYRDDGSNLIGYLNIHRFQPIDQSTYLQVKFALEDYIKRGVIFVILRLNTPGGEVFSAMKIAELLQELDTVHHIPVVAVINNWALSAGAMLAYSCRFIAITNTSLMGAAEPVIAGSDGKMESASEKIVSAMRAEFASLAKYYGRNPLIAEAMVDKDIILVKRQGEIMQLPDDSAIRMQGETADEVITKRGKLLTLNAEQLIDFKVADFMLQITATHDVSPLELDVGEWPASQSQLFSFPFFSKIPFATLIYYRNWKIDFFAFLTNPLVASLLMMGFIIGIYMEMSHPGLMLPGATALICLGLILLSNFATETINGLEIIFVVVGVLLFLIEMFAMPGFGLIGTLGIILVIFGLFAMMLPNIDAVHFSWDWQKWNLQTLEFFDLFVYYAAALILALLIIALLGRFITKRLLGKSPLVLRDDQEGSAAAPEKIALPPVDSEGEAFTSLRPGGKILIENHLYDALADASFIAQGEKVVIVKIEGNAIIVAKKITKA